MRHLPHPNLRRHAFVFGVALLSIVACQPATAATSGLSPAATTPETPAASVKSPESAPTQIAASGSLVAPLSPTQTAGERIDLSGPPSSPTPLPTVTSTPTQLPTATPTPTDTPSPTPTATPIGPCDQRDPGDELLALVTLEYGLSRDYVPSDLVPISGFFSNAVTLGYPTEIRQPVLEPLREMINDMLDEGLQPMIISGYRSYATQALAWDKWREQEPDRAQILSAPPGYSEHQLGTTIDFGSPELADIVGQEDIQFHTHFYMTRESIWLAENAHRYGFTLSYPREAFDLTGFYYEPWHYRYVGVELATYLKEQGLFLAQYLFETQPLPCIP